VSAFTGVANVPLLRPNPIGEFERLLRLVGEPFETGSRGVGFESVRSSREERLDERPERRVVVDVEDRNIPARCRLVTGLG